MSAPRLRLLLPLVLVTAAACAHRPQRAAPVVITVRPEEVFQTIRNFGASDAWSIQFVGAHWPEEKRDRVADLLFSLRERPDGSPVGIGLSAWRFNLGAGSAGQGAESGIPDRWRRAGSFLRPDGSFDGSGQPGQRAFLRAARERGVEQFIGFVNSPPVALTRNGRAHSSGGDSANLAPARYGDFARFLRDATLHLQRREGVTLSYLSPFNEPQWDWTGGQEGSPWTNAEIAEAVRVLDATLAESGLSTRIEIAEAGKLNYLYESADRPGRGEQVRAFFDPASPHHIGSLPNVARKIAGHSYYTTHPEATLREVRERVRQEIAAVDPGLEFWMTEYCVLENHPGIRGRGRDLGMDAALYTAGVIHSDLVDARASAWQWWLAVSPYDYKDGLVYIDPDTLDGAVYESKLLWALGHYSRFVRPGMRRIGAEVSDGAGADLLVSAYREPASSRTVLVLVNRDTTEREVEIRLPGAPALRLYRTTAEAGVDLRFEGRIRPRAPVRLPARSMATFVAEGAASNNGTETPPPPRIATPVARRDRP